MNERSKAKQGRETRWAEQLGRESHAMSERIWNDRDWIWPELHSTSHFHFLRCFASTNCHLHLFADAVRAGRPSRRHRRASQIRHLQQISPACSIRQRSCPSRILLGPPAISPKSLQMPASCAIDNSTRRSSRRITLSIETEKTPRCYELPLRPSNYYFFLSSSFISLPLRHRQKSFISTLPC